MTSGQRDALRGSGAALGLLPRHPCTLGRAGGCEGTWQSVLAPPEGGELQVSRGAAETPESEPRASYCEEGRQGILAGGGHRGVPEGGRAAVSLRALSPPAPPQCTDGLVSPLSPGPHLENGAEGGVTFAEEDRPGTGRLAE